jgi:hypothetical protein
MPKRFVCGWLALSHRYEGRSTRSLQRDVKNGKLPKPRYRGDNRTPIWDEDELDDHDEKTLLTRHPEQRRPAAEIAAPPEPNAEIAASPTEDDAIDEPERPRRARGRPRRDRAAASAA